MWSSCELLDWILLILISYPQNGLPTWHSGKESPMQEMQEMWLWSLGWATHSSILAWKIPWTEEPGGLQSMESQRIVHDWACIIDYPQSIRQCDLCRDVLAPGVEDWLWVAGFRSRKSFNLWTSINLLTSGQILWPSLEAPVALPSLSHSLLGRVTTWVV